MTSKVTDAKRVLSEYYLKERDVRLKMKEELREEKNSK